MARRRLTEGRPSHRNGGLDTEEFDLVICQGDVLFNSEHRRRYCVLSKLGSGTFGQVVLCRCLETQDEVAVKVIKNDPSYHRQALTETQILRMLNTDARINVVRMLDQFVHARHLCIVFERLECNLFTLIEANRYRGLELHVVAGLVKQVLVCLKQLRCRGIIHCDLKLENIMISRGAGDVCKVIDLGSACFENQTQYTYIQSRYYRSPEVLLGHSYNTLVDMWSLGCVAAELFLGLPLFPGDSKYDMLRRIHQYIGHPTTQFLSRCTAARSLYLHERLLTPEQYQRVHHKAPEIGRNFFRHLPELGRPHRLEDVIRYYPMDQTLTQELRHEEAEQRECFLHFLKGTLAIDPETRWTPWQALQHPFMNDQPLDRDWVPPLEPADMRPHVHRSAHAAPVNIVPRVDTASAVGATQQTPFADAVPNTPNSAMLLGTSMLGGGGLVTPRHNIGIHSAMSGALSSTLSGALDSGLSPRNIDGSIPQSAFPQLGSSFTHQSGLGAQSRYSNKVRRVSSSSTHTGLPVQSAAMQMPQQHGADTGWARRSSGVNHGVDLGNVGSQLHSLTLAYPSSSQDPGVGLQHMHGAELAGDYGRGDLFSHAMDRNARRSTNADMGMGGVRPVAAGYHATGRTSFGSSYRRSTDAQHDSTFDPFDDQMEPFSAGEDLEPADCLHEGRGAVIFPGAQGGGDSFGGREHRNIVRRNTIDAPFEARGLTREAPVGAELGSQAAMAPVLHNLSYPGGNDDDTILALAPRSSSMTECRCRGPGDVGMQETNNINIVQRSCHTLAMSRVRNEMFRVDFRVDLRAKGGDESCPIGEDGDLG